MHREILLIMIVCLIAAQVQLGLILTQSCLNSAYFYVTGSAVSVAQHVPLILPDSDDVWHVADTSILLHPQLGVSAALVML